MRKNRLLRSGLALMIALVLVLSAIPIAGASASPTVTLSSGSVKAGQSVTLTVSIKNNPGLAACILYFYFDTDVFVADGNSARAAGEFREDGGFLGNTIEIAKSNGRYYGLPGKDGVLGYWYNSSGMNTNGDGAFMTLTLKVKDNAPNGSYAIGLGYSTIDCRNEDGDKVALNTKGGTVTVSGGSSGGGSSPGGSSSDDIIDAPDFVDVSGHWAEDYIWAAADLGLMEGNVDEYGEAIFRPDDSLTRAEFVTVLWRALGEPKATKPANYNDLTQSWYMEAIAWATENNVIQGDGTGNFYPLVMISREQVALILHRMAGTPGILVPASLYDNLYEDSGQVSSWAKSGLYWAVYKEIYCDTDAETVGNTLAPTADATRAQIAVMMVRYLEKEGGF